MSSGGVEHAFGWCRVLAFSQTRGRLDVFFMSRYPITQALVPSLPCLGRRSTIIARTVNARGYGAQTESDMSVFWGGGLRDGVMDCDAADGRNTWRDVGNLSFPSSADMYPPFHTSERA